MNINKSSRIFNTIFRKKLITKIEKLKDINYYIDIFNLIKYDIKDNYSSNRNGIFININLLSDNTIELLNFYLENKLNEIQVEKLSYKSYSTNDIDSNYNCGHKLSKQDKHIIKNIATNYN